MAEQTHCPDPGCVSALPLLPNGWTLIGELWWCPLHALGEGRRLQKHQQELLWYDGSIRVREQVVADFETDEQRLLARAKAAQLDRKDPRVQRRQAAIEERADRAREELAELKRNRDNATARHELENENRRNPLKIVPETAEN